MKQSGGGPVSRVLSHASVATVISLAGRLPGRSSGLPGSHNGPDRPCSLIWPCSRWGLPSQPVARLLVGSYIKELASPHLFTLTSEEAVYFLLHFPGPSSTAPRVGKAVESNGGRYPPPRP